MVAEDRSHWMHPNMRLGQITSVAPLLQHSYTLAVGRFDCDLGWGAIGELEFQNAGVLFLTFRKQLKVGPIPVGLTPPSPPPQSLQSLVG